MSDLRTSEAPETIEQTLGIDIKPHRLAAYLKYLPLVGVAIIAAFIAVVMMDPFGSEKTPTFMTAEVARGDLTVFVTATGTLQPVNQVDVGAEVSGQILEVNVDFNDKVAPNQVLARLDTAQLEARVRQSAAQLESARARVKETEATELEARNALKRSLELFGRGNVSEQALDNAKAAHARALASVASAEAQVTVSEANLTADETNLSKAVITSPINGIVLSRKIEAGQTVASQFQTPILFTLAEDLTQMELVIDIDEADIGQVKEGQLAFFNVDAFPNRSFPASITSVRFAPKTVEGVVTYEALLAADNQELFLRPGMTATATITTAVRSDALLVPNTALRFQPAGPPRARNGSASGPPGLFRMFRFGSPRSEQKPLPPTADAEGVGRLWTLEDGQPSPSRVQVGITDGVKTELLTDEIVAGTRVVTGIERQPL